MLFYHGGVFGVHADGQKFALPAKHIENGIFYFVIKRNSTAHAVPLYAFLPLGGKNSAVTEDIRRVRQYVRSVNANKAGVFQRPVLPFRQEKK